MSARTSLIPGQEGRALPGVVAVMVLVATLTVVAALLLSGAVRAWQGQLETALTVEIPASEPPGAQLEHLNAALRVLQQIPGVTGARALSEAELDALLQPWLGPGAASAGLPVPRLIDVTVARDLDAPAALVAERLRVAVPDARVDDHGLWLDEVRRLAHTMQAGAAAVVALVAAAMAAVVAFATRAGMLAHRQVVEVLHLVGARDAYIARQFQGRAMAFALQGGLAGLGLAALVVGALWLVARDVNLPLLAWWEMPTLAAAALPLVPAAAVAIAGITARATAMRLLSRMV